MPITIASFLIPRAGGTYFLMEDKFILGGFRVVVTLADRDAIDESCRKEGMHVYVLEDSKLYKMGADLISWSEASTAGPAGADGKDGANGTNGVDGTRIYSGVGIPAVGLGVTGDYYIDSDTFGFYKKESTEWLSLGSLKGSNGAAGIDGVDGVTIKSSNAAPTISDAGNDDDLWLDLASFDLYKRVAGVWQSMGNIKGDQGQRGSKWLYGTTAPAAGAGQSEDFYLNTVTGDIYTRGAAAWSLVANIKGSKGDAGTNGVSFLSGSAVPSDAVGSNGDSYINFATFDIYSKVSGSWVSKGNIKGAKGDAGTNGTNGTNGVDGLSLLSGTTSPTPSAGKNDDLYIDLTSLEFFKKIDGVWTSQGILKGTPGNDGTTVYSGATAPDAGLGGLGDLFVDLATYNFYRRDAAGWQFSGCLKGVDGTNGTNGVDGYSTLSGATDPDAALGKNNDLYINLTTFDAFKKTSGSWVKQGNLKGAAGTNGVNGSNGTSILSGATDPDAAAGGVGDLYLNLSSLTIFKKSLGAWSAESNIKGAKGDTGAAGTNGTNGTNGVDGSKFLSGAVVPAAGLGSDNDFYLNTATFDVSKKTSGAWTLQCNIKGAAGTNGTNGTNGVDGTNGLSVLSGTSDPSSAVGANSELYINTQTFDVFKKSAGAWSKQGNLKGSDGTSNVKWYNTTIDPVVGTPVAAQGDYCLNTSSGDVFQLGASAWAKVGNLKGAAGKDYDPLTTTLNMPYDLSIFVPGNMLEAAVTVYTYIAARKISLHQNLPGSIAVCRIAPTIEVCDYDIQVNGVSKGTLHFDSGSNTGVFSWPTGLNLNVGDKLTIITPLFVDTALQDLSITMVGVAAAPNGVLLP